MSYPSWAPMELIDLLRKRKEMRAAGKPGHSDSNDVERELLRIQEEHPGLTQENIDLLRQQLWRNCVFLPPAEGDRLLERLVTNQQMKGVWEALAKRAKNDRYAISYWQTCDSTVCAWRGNPRHSPTERREQLTKLQEAAATLSRLMSEVPEFHLYSQTHLITDKQVQWVRDALECYGPYDSEAENISYTRFTVSEIVPDFQMVLMDIHRKAGECAASEPVVRKPQSKNAEVHHFVRVLSGYVKREYGQPLHDAIAMTACTTFERDDIDVDYVRKLVSD